MLIGINKKPVDSNTPWGGGNVLLHNLCSYLKDHGNTLEFSPYADCDLFFIMDPRGADEWYDVSKVAEIPIVQRVGDLGTHSKPEILDMLSDRLPKVDHTIFPSVWAYDYFKDKRLWGDTIKYSIIPNTADDSFFKRKKMRLVTHHWSDNPNKGMDVYEWLQENAKRLDIEFTFIGRPCFELKEDTVHMPPVSKDTLAYVLPSYDFYITASRLEAGANHVLEALACNLPIIYHTEGGSIPEYCKHRGIPYSSTDDLEKILRPLPLVQDVLEKYLNVFKEVVNE